jgi:steroid delta-isomerase-like uncharacterized protein
MENKTVILNWIKATDANDSAALEKLFGPRHQFYGPFGPDPMGMAQHVGMLKSFESSFSNVGHEVLDLFEAGNKVVLRGIWVGTQIGEFNGIPASGKTVRSPFISIFEIDNGEIINQWLQFDLMSFTGQMGAGPQGQSAN